MDTIKVRIDANGDVRFLVSEGAPSFRCDGAIIRRASHVEPNLWWLRWTFHALRAVFGEYGVVGNWTRTWSVTWRVNLSPVNGPILPETFTNRQAAIDTEVVWLNQNFL